MRLETNHRWHEADLYLLSAIIHLDLQITPPASLNNTLICKVDDQGVCHKEPIKPPKPKQDFYKPKRPISANIPITPPQPANIITGISQSPCKEDAQPDIGFLYSQAWREELRDLTAKVEFFPEPMKEAKEEENLKWGYQYSGERGRLCPSPTRPISWTASRPISRAGATDCARPGLTVAEREVLVLELLSQILQTDSLQAVQHWLLTTGHKEKEMMLDLIRIAVANMRFGSSNVPTCTTLKESLSSRQSAEDTDTTMFRAQSACERRRARSQCQCQRLESILEKQPEREGDAKMLEMTTSNSCARQYSPQTKTIKKSKTLGSTKKVLIVPSSPILSGKLCHSKTDLSKP
ncbi:protein TBATA-like isoform X2 [Heterodontus francisci]|uniref:protein TBATA-like isoform X2 n=1 Tax=Heterodontus francisci TaxID=7792 RepID=UPI00355AFBDF